MNFPRWISKQWALYFKCCDSVVVYLPPIKISGYAPGYKELFVVTTWASSIFCAVRFTSIAASNGAWHQRAGALGAHPVRRWTTQKFRGKFPRFLFFLFIIFISGKCGGVPDDQTAVVQVTQERRTRGAVVGLWCRIEFLAVFWSLCSSWQDIA